MYIYTTVYVYIYAYIFAVEVKRPGKQTPHDWAIPKGHTSLGVVKGQPFEKPPIRVKHIHGIRGSGFWDVTPRNGDSNGKGHG